MVKIVQFLVKIGQKSQFFQRKFKENLVFSQNIVFNDEIIQNLRQNCTVFDQNFKKVNFFQWKIQEKLVF